MAREQEVIAGRFELQSVIGTGGMGSVWRAFDRDTAETVAVKVMHALSAIEAVRFKRESSVLARLTHPAIVRHIAHGETPDGAPWLAMEWLDGEDLSARLRREGLRWSDAALLCARIAEALAVAHGLGVVHRDVKPGNVFLVGRDPTRARLLDFGVARSSQATAALTKTDAVLGTVGYMSPEQAMGSDLIDGRADLFSLGCVLYECVTGEALYSRGPMMATLARLLAADAPRLRDKRPELPVELDELVASMLSRDASKRPASGLEVSERLRAIADAVERPSQVTSAPREVLTADEQRIVSVIVVTQERDTADARVSEVTRAAGSFAERLRGRVTRLGDALVVTFDGATPDKVAACALGLSELAPDARLALAMGRATVTGAHTAGPAIDSAVGVLRGARDAGVWVNDLAARLLEDRFEVARSALGARLVAHGASRAKLPIGKGSPCVGRERELGMLEAALSECEEESVARALIVSAAAGVGKSRLAHEFVARIKAQDRASVVTVRVDPVASASPLSLVRRVVREAAGVNAKDPPAVQEKALRAAVSTQLAGEAGARAGEFLCELVGLGVERPCAALVSARAESRVMLDWTERVLAEWFAAMGASRAWVLVIEDLQWADAASVGLLTDALRRVKNAAWMVLLLTRPEAQESFAGLWSLSLVTEISLGALPRRAAEKLVRGVLGADADPAVVGRVLARAGGNAFCLEELLRKAAEGGDVSELPDTVLAMAQARLDGLHPEARQCLRAASVFGETFWAGGVSALLGAETGRDLGEWLDALVEAEVIDASGGRSDGELRAYAFRHGLLREAAWSMLTPADQRAGHRAAALWLEPRGLCEPMVLAEHWERGGNGAAAVPWIAKAAEGAVYACAIDASISLAERGIALDPNGPHAPRFRAIVVWALNTCGRLTEACALAAGLLSESELGSPLWWQAAGTLIYGAASVPLAQAAMPKVVGALLDPRVEIPPTASVAYSLMGLVMALFFFGRAEVALKIIDRMQSVRGEADESFRALLSCLKAFTHETVVYDPAALLREAQAAVDAMRAMDERRGLAMVLVYLAAAENQIGDFERAERSALEGVEVGASLSNRVKEGWCLYHLYAARVAAGKHALADETFDAITRSDDRAVVLAVLPFRAKALRERGALDAAEALASKALEAPSPMLLSRTTARLVRVRVALARGDVARARAELDEAESTAARLAILHEHTDLFLARYEVLHAELREADALAALTEAKGWVLSGAETLRDEPAARQSFLTRAPWNARVMALADARGV